MSDVALFEPAVTVEPVTLEVIGEPRPKGSKTAVIVKTASGPRAVVIESKTKEGRRMQTQWINDVRSSAQQWRDANPGEPFDVPLAMTIVFYLQRPKTAPRRVIWPAKKPDWDKLSRLVCDALKGVVYRDDALICRCSVEKQFAVDRPAGCTITVEVL